MNPQDLLPRFAAALAAGVLIGLQREFALGDPKKEIPAGVRTFALLGLSGAAGGALSAETGSFLPFAAVIALLGLFLGIGVYVDAVRGRPGLTTRVAALLTVLIGGLAAMGHATFSVALAVIVTTVLSAKVEMHRFVRHLTREDVFAALKFAVVSAVILPFLPDREFGPRPFDVVNPFKIWLFVVLISGIGFIGYVLVKWKGAHRGMALTGFLGGITSSTAVTVSFTRRSARQPSLGRPLAAAVMLAWTVMFGRVAIGLFAVNRGLLAPLWPCIAAGAAASALSFFLLSRGRGRDAGAGSQGFSNPFELGTAMRFGLLFAAVILVSRAAETAFGDRGLLAAGFVSGLADVDAVLLSAGSLAKNPGGPSPGLASDAIAMALIANTLTKGVVALTAGCDSFRRAVWPGFIFTLAALAAAMLLT